MKSQIRFVEERVKESFEKLRESKTKDKKLYEWINRALNDLEENAFVGFRFLKNLFLKSILTNTALIIYGNMTYQKDGG